MSTSWKLQDAKDRFSEIVERALSVGPKTVTRHGEPAAVVVSVETWRRISAEAASFKDFLRSAPIEGLALDRDGQDHDEAGLP